MKSLAVAKCETYPMIERYSKVVCGHARRHADLLDAYPNVDDVFSTALRHGHPDEVVVIRSMVADHGPRAVGERDRVVVLDVVYLLDAGRGAGRDRTRQRVEGREWALRTRRNKRNVHACSIQCFPTAVMLSRHLERGTRRWRIMSNGRRNATICPAAAASRVRHPIPADMHTTSEMGGGRTYASFLVRLERYGPDSAGRTPS